jgi:hypothetical protein
VTIMTFPDRDRDSAPDDPDDREATTIERTLARLVEREQARRAHDRNP